MLRRKLANYILFTVIFAVLSKAKSSDVTQCLMCWNDLCDDEIPSGLSNICSNPCIGFTSMSIGGLVHTENAVCCSYANTYVSSVENDLTPLPFNSAEECPNDIYNDMPENFDINNYEDGFAVGEQYFLFSEVQFGCSGCVRNVSIYSKLSVEQDKPVLSAFQIWATEQNITGNQTVLTLKNEIMVYLTRDDSNQLTSSLYQTTKTLNASTLCFEAGDIFGITMARDIQVLTSKDSSGTKVYKTEERSNCGVLRELYYIESDYLTNPPLIAIGITRTDAGSSSSQIGSTSSSKHNIMIGASSQILSTDSGSSFSQMDSTLLGMNMITTSSQINSPARTSLSKSVVVSQSTTTHHHTSTSQSTPLLVQPTVTSQSFINSNLAVVIVVAIVVVVVVLLIVVAVIISICLCFKLRSSKDGYLGIQMFGHTGRFSRDSLDFQIATTRRSPNDGSVTTSQFSTPTPPPSLPPPRNSSRSRELLQTNYYDDPTHFLDRPGQGGYLGNGQNHHHYESMDTGIMMDNQSPFNTSRSTVSDNTYSRPRIHLNHEQHVLNDYDVPSRNVSSNSQYDEPTALRGTLDPYREQEDFLSPQGNNIEVFNRARENGPKYFIIDQDSARRGSEIKTHFYHVMEQGHHVPSAEERTATEPSMNTVGNEPQQFFEDQPQYWEPADKAELIYDQLSEKKCRELKRNEIKLTEEIGSGEFGTVWCGEWLLRGGGTKGVAIKVLKSNAKEEEKAWFLREGARMMQFFHSNVVQLYGVVTLGEPILLVLELMKEGDLLKFLEDRRPDNGKKPIPPPSQLLKFCRDIAIGMRHLAKKKFVHRDLAARNILLNEKLICKIGDFGMTRAYSHTYDKNKPMCVPLRWTAPEALRSREYSEKSDVYSYGMVIYEIWSLGRKPFPTEERIEIIKSFVNQGRIMAPPPGCPREIYRLMAQCWHPDPSERPTFSDVYNDFLDTNDETLLNWSSEDLDPSTKASELGADLVHGYRLYQEIQYQYRTAENQ